MQKTPAKIHCCDKDEVKNTENSSSHPTICSWCAVGSFYSLTSPNFPLLLVLKPKINSADGSGSEPVRSWAGKSLRLLQNLKHICNLHRMTSRQRENVGVFFSTFLLKNEVICWRFVSEQKCSGTTPRGVLSTCWQKKQYRIISFNKKDCVFAFGNSPNWNI